MYPLPQTPLGDTNKYLAGQNSINMPLLNGYLYFRPTFHFFFYYIIYTGLGEMSTKRKLSTIYLATSTFHCEILEYLKDVHSLPEAVVWSIKLVGEIRSYKIRATDS